MGTLEVMTYPQGATVYVNGSKEGITPVEIGGIPLGFVEIEVSLEGYDLFSSIFHFHPHQSISLDLYLSSKDYLLEEIVALDGSLPRGMFIGSDNLFLLSTSGEFLSFDPSTREVLWKKNLETIVLSPPGLGEGVAYGATFYGTIYLLHEETGEHLLTWETGRAIRKILSSHSLLFLLHNDRTLFVWEDGEKLWSYTDREGIDIVFDEDLLFVTEDRLLFFQPLTGILEEEIELVGPLKRLYLHDRILYLVGPQGMIYGVDVKERSLAFELHTKVSGEITSILVEDGILYLGTEEGDLLAFKGEESLWERHLGEDITFLYVHQHLLVGTGQRSLYFLERDEGTYIARKALFSQLTGLYPHQGDYFLALRDGTLAHLKVFVD